MIITKNIVNDIDKMNLIYFGIYQIMYNITVILNEVDFYYDRNTYCFNNQFVKNMRIEIIDNIKYFTYEDKKYYRKNNILYMEKNNKIYWIENEIYYMNEINNIKIDDEKTFISINDLLFNDLNLIVVLNSICKILNIIINYKEFMTISRNKIIFNNQCKNMINLNFFFYIDNNKFYLKEFWEFYECSNKNTIIKLGMNLIYLLNSFNSVKFHFKKNILL